MYTTHTQDSVTTHQQVNFRIKPAILLQPKTATRRALSIVATL